MIGTMALICEYFAAPTDAVAAQTIDWTGGPSRPPTAAGETAAPGRLATVEMPGVEPVVMLRSLEAILTDIPLVDLPKRSTAPVAMRDAGERLILPVSPDLLAALAGSDDARLTRAAWVWAQTPEFAGRADPIWLGERLSLLAALAREARRRDEHVYCWMSL